MKRCLKWIGGSLLGVLVLLGAGGVWITRPQAFPAAPSPRVAPVVSAPWWEAPPVVTEEELAVFRYVESVTSGLPPEQVRQVWNMGGDQRGVFSIRYQAAFAGYAAAALGMRRPAWPEASGAVLRACIERLLDRQSWSYISAYWRNEPTFPDPVAHENIMYSGHLLQLLALYEALTGDAVYRVRGFDFVWEDGRRFHYTTLTLAEAIAIQMRADPSGGVACEPGLIFFPCNNHAQIGLRLLEGLGVGNWRRERERWERFVLRGYHSTLGDGAVRLMYWRPGRRFVPVALSGGDGWALLWYAPWADDPSVVQGIWQETAARLPWERFRGRDNELAVKGCCRVKSPYPPVSELSFLFPAALACADRPTAQRLRGALESLGLTRDARGTYLSAPAWLRIAVTANYLTGLALEHGSDLRALVQRPLPRDYFEGPLLKRVVPATTPVFETRREGSALIVGLQSQGAVTLTLCHVPAIARVEGVGPGDWSYDGERLQVRVQGRTQLRIQPVSGVRTVATPDARRAGEG